MKDTESQTSRIEDKYIISKDYLNEFLKSANHFMELDFPQPNTEYCLNKSIYFDNSNFMCLKEHLQKDTNRYKIRVRTYAPDGKWSNDYFIEIKQKYGEECVKNRLKISKESFNHLMKKNEILINQELITFNEDQVHEADIIVNAKLINSLLKTNNFKPIVEITYKRLSYGSGENFRITIDQNLKVKPLKDFPYKADLDKKFKKELKKFEYKFIDGEDFILEVKHTGGYPQWLSNKLNKLILQPEKYSKYVWSISRILNGK